VKNKILVFINNYGLIIAGISMLLISIVILRNGYLDKEITERNETVSVKVIDCYETGKSNYFIKFEFNNRVIVKRTKAEYCRKLKNKSEVEMLSNETFDRFIFLEEYESDNDFLFGFILSGLALLIIFKGSKKLKRN
jgi:hypothetical protein